MTKSIHVPDLTVLPIKKMSAVEAAAYIGVSKGWLDKLRHVGGGPDYIKIGRRIVYDITDIEAWLANKRLRHTSEKVAQP